MRGQIDFKSGGQDSCGGTLWFGSNRVLGESAAKTHLVSASPRGSELGLAPFAGVAGLGVGSVQFYQALRRAAGGLRSAGR